MAIKTKKDLQIDNISYTNKDFAQIYPELVDLAKKITNKWDPATTNESDPGLVFLKLFAFIGDKNILEQFMPSVTQETSMRNLCDMMGYNISYYKSATTTIAFSYLGGNTDLDAILDNGGTFKLKAFDTSFKTEDNIVFTLLEDIQITNQTRTNTNKRVIQGQLKALNITDSTISDTNASKIQLYNLDDNNRIYLPDAMVAENGVFINREIESTTNQDNVWRRVDNLNDYAIGSKVFKFGFDSSKRLPYIEFPSDIADLIGDGLEIYYIVTDGVNGYANLNSITSINAASISVEDYSGSLQSTPSLADSDYSLSNPISTNGAEPETIDEAYRNFKKTVGTFNTLVSCDDYSNGIYLLEDSNGGHYVSNVQAKDIRTDPNRSYNILKRDALGMSYYTNVVKTGADGNLPKDTSYNDLILHGTKPYNYDITNLSNYNGTYKPLDDEDINDIDIDLANIKTISHKLTRPLAGEINFIENRYTLKVNISTTYKVNTTEQTNILKNVRNALYNNFNAREVEFGEEIPYDEIIRVIEEADERIKLVIVDDPTITSCIIKSDGNSENDIVVFDPNSDDLSRSIIVDNILGGRIQLYIKDNSFSFDYDMDLASLKQQKYLGAVKSSVTMSIPLTSRVSYKWVNKNSLNNLYALPSGTKWLFIDSVPSVEQAKEGLYCLNTVTYIAYKSVANEDSYNWIELGPLSDKLNGYDTIIFGENPPLDDEAEENSDSVYIDKTTGNIYLVDSYTETTGESYEVQKNETIQIVEDSYISKITYPAYVYYGFGKEEGSSFNTIKDVPYKLMGNNLLYIYYVDSNDTVQIIPYKKDTIIRTTGFEFGDETNKQAARWLNSSATQVYDSQSGAGTGAIPLYAIGQNETIEILTQNKVTLKGAQQNCFWYTQPIIKDSTDGNANILNQVDNDLIFYKDDSKPDTYYHILEENEVFIYPSDDMFTLNTLGSGTKLEVTVTGDQFGAFTNDQGSKYGEGTIYLEVDSRNKEKNKVIDLGVLSEAINSQDVATFRSSYNWNIKDFASVNLNIVETSISTFVEKDKVAYTKEENSTFDGSLNGTWKSISNINIGGVAIGNITNAKIRAVLTVNGNSTTPQQLLDNQTITLYYYLDTCLFEDKKTEEPYIDEETSEENKKPVLKKSEEIKGKYIQFNGILDNYGDIILRTPRYDEVDTSLRFNSEYSVPYSIVYYNKFDINIINGKEEEEKSDNEKLYELIENLGVTKSATRDEYLIPFNKNSVGGTDSTLKNILNVDHKLVLDMPTGIDNIYINVFDNDTAKTLLINCESSGNKNTITLDFNNIFDSEKDVNVIISVPTLLNINPLLEERLDETALTEITDTIEAKYTDFDYLAELNSSKLIDSYDVVNSFFDYNNIYNSLTLPKIDFENSEFKIVASSRK